MNKSTLWEVEGIEDEQKQESCIAFVIKGQPQELHAIREEITSNPNVNLLYQKHSLGYLKIVPATWTNEHEEMKNTMVLLREQISLLAYQNKMLKASMRKAMKEEE